VTLDRQSIEKRDFPVARRGYDQRAVEAHLAEIADALESIRTESRAASAADQVRQIVGAAERSAAEIRRDAADEARDHVATVAQAADRMLQRIEAMDADVNALIESVREGVKRLKADLTALQTEVADVSPGAAAPPPEQTAPEETIPAPPQPAPAPSNGAAAEDEEAARLVALNMALSGVSREDAKKDLGEQFDVPDLDGLLDDVYARAGGS
jgi:DivIVA domain-containing protein